MRVVRTHPAWRGKGQARLFSHCPQASILFIPASAPNKALHSTSQPLRGRDVE